MLVAPLAPPVPPSLRLFISMNVRFLITYYSSNFIFLFCRVEGNSPTVLLSRKVSLEHEGPPVEFCFRETGSSPLIVYGTAYGGIVGKFFFSFSSFFLQLSTFLNRKQSSLMFRYSEKAVKIWHRLFLNLLTNVKKFWKILSNGLLRISELYLVMVIDVCRSLFMLDTKKSISYEMYSKVMVVQVEYLFHNIPENERGNLIILKKCSFTARFYLKVRQSRKQLWSPHFFQETNETHYPE